MYWEASVGVSYKGQIGSGCLMDGGYKNGQGSKHRINKRNINQTRKQPLDFAFFAWCPCLSQLPYVNPMGSFMGLLFRSGDLKGSAQNAQKGVAKGAASKAHGKKNRSKDQKG